MISPFKERVLVTCDQSLGHSLRYMANQLDWSTSKTARAAMQIGLTKLIWAHDIVNRRWERSDDNSKSEAIHWLEVSGILPEGMFDQLEKEINVEAERRKWREATKAGERLGANKVDSEKKSRRE